MNWPHPVLPGRGLGTRIPSDISVGEKVLFLGTGAYAREMAAHSFCGFPRPEVVLLEDLVPRDRSHEKSGGKEAGVGA